MPSTSLFRLIRFVTNYIFAKQHLSSGETGQKALIGRSATNRHCNRFRNILSCEL